MTPEEKAKKLVDIYYRITGLNHISKICAIVAVNELIDSHLLLTTTHDKKPSIRCKTYWREVKEEIILIME